MELEKIIKNLKEEIDLQKKFFANSNNKWEIFEKEMRKWKNIQDHQKIKKYQILKNIKVWQRRKKKLERDFFKEKERILTKDEIFDILGEIKTKLIIQEQIARTMHNFFQEELEKALSLSKYLERTNAEQNAINWQDLKEVKKILVVNVTKIWIN